MTDSCARNSRFVNSTSTMPVQLTKLVMSASVTVRPIVLNCRPTGKSSKQKPSPTVSIGHHLSRPSRDFNIAAAEGGEKIDDRLDRRRCVLRDGRFATSSG